MVLQAHGIDHLVIPTRDYLFAPSFVDIRRAVDFIHSEYISYFCGPFELLCILVDFSLKFVIFFG